MAAIEREWAMTKGVTTALDDGGVNLLYTPSSPGSRSMAKYYVQSGTFRSIVNAESPSKAAIWAIHQVMRQIVPTDDDSFTPAVAGESQSLTPMMVLGARVQIDERGFDRCDAKELKTIEVVSLWNEMVLTLDRLQSMMHQ